MKLYKYLLEMNEEVYEEADKNHKRKFSGDNDQNSYSFENAFKTIYDNYISNFCTIYLDFDCYSNKLLSNMVFS